MSQSEEPIGEKEFCVEIAKQGRAACKKCKQKCLKDEIRIAKLVHNPFGDGKMKSWHHVECLFEVFLKQRPTTKRIESIDDIDGFDQLPSDSQDIILKRVEKSNTDIREKFGAKVDTPSKKTKPVVSKKLIPAADETSLTIEKSKPYPFKDFRRLVAQITNVNGYLEKTEIVSNLFKKGIDGNGFQGDIHLWCKLLLPGVIKRIYNLQSKQLVKIFSRLFKTDQAKMLEHLEQGDIGETIQQFYEMSPVVRPVKKSNLTVEQVDEFLEELSKLTKEEEQMSHFLSILKSCTSNDLKIIIRLIKHDLRMNAGAKHILEGVHPDAYTAYQSSRDLGVVLKKCLSGEGKPNSTKGVSAAIKVMTPILPMLAEACKSVEMAMSKCPNGMYSEIKYDGERVQVHKKGSEFKYFSRSLKPVLQHKIAHFKDHIPEAFISGNDLILDSEILMIDTETQAPLPFGSLGKHKRDEYENACVCLYVFDCLYYNGEDLTKRPIEYRKKILRQNMTEVKNHIVFSESKIVHKPSELREMMIKVFKLGLEGLVLKDLKSIYEPGKRHWLKVKKDYLFDGAMADTADLIVLGAWYGTGKKGGKMSVFLMGCYDEKRKRFYTVTKVHTGLDDKTLDDLQNKLDMIKISSNPSKVPDWLVCNRPMVPDFVAKDPKNQPVWEITGAEFTQHDVHTANGISIRFPRITKRRDDKDWKTATSLEELKTLYEKSKEHTDVTLLLKGDTDVNERKSTDNTADTDSNAIQNDSPKELNKKRKLEDSPDIKKKPKNKQVNHITELPKNGLNNTKNSEMITTNNISLQEPNKKRKIEESPPLETKHTTKKENHKNNGPLYFQGVRLYLEEEVKPLFESWNKNFSSYGGILLNSNEMHKATHVLHMNRFVKDVERRYPAEARHVLFSWIDDTIKENQLQDYQLYSVKWRPDL